MSDQDAGSPNQAQSHRKRADLYLKLPGINLFLGEFEIDESLPTLCGGIASIVLKIGQYTGPDLTGFTGRELVIPLQPATEFLHEQKG